MRKQIINVPEYVEYISEWNEYQYPLGHCIVDKTICGCGYTEYCLCNQYPTILCSPRKVLLENKEGQHQGDLYYFKNEKEGSLGVDNDILEKEETIDDSIKIDYLTSLKVNLVEWIAQRISLGFPPKILVTYDSLKHVLDALGSTKNNYMVVVDEFQSIFMDSRFKADIEMNFVEYLQDCPNVLYLSATPMLDKYLNRLDYFRDLPYYELQWPQNRISRIQVNRRPVKSIVTEVSKIIQDYRNGIFPRKVFEDKVIHESREVVFFVNSVRTITEIIKRNKLDPSETNIICAHTSKNKMKLRKIKHSYGEIPKRGKPWKMFTFCTRTTYLGADFYSTNASTVICSDCGVETLTVDISLDLPQIMGRQRLDENVFRGECLFLYKISKNSDMNFEEYSKYLSEKRKTTEIILGGYQKLTEEEKLKNSEIYKDNIKAYKYSNNFIGISEKTGLAIYNYLVEIADQRAWEISQIDYQNGCYIKKTMEDNNFIVSDLPDGSQGLLDINLEYHIFLQEFSEENWFDKKMRLYCEFIKKFYPLLGTTNIPSIPQEYQNYVNLLGPDRCKALGYYQASLEREYQVITSGDTRKEVILNNFQVQQRYSLKEIKEKLREIYQNLGITKTPKASDLEEYYEVKKTKITTSDGVKDGYLIEKIK
jgi:hypothetical protein